MILIIGGAYQGKLDYAKAAFSLTPEDIFTCAGAEIDFSKRCVNALEEFCYACVQQELDPVDYFRSHEGAWQDSILICNDLSSGVVPMDAADRQWRHSTGRLCQYLARQANQVSRIFCGLEQRLK
ncbi:MAG: bifunctional adenosylcobinamide kinase/adenosylcobinamide-phosphate guanylyltransferase [Eubacteriales bacterium]|nr:bifunctional adenosylcobinamide kinase/adenosylcobinamide-phosphate guanylyltransferase [Eubacteriales bacterium]